MEIENILIEHLLQDDKYVRLSDIKRTVIRSSSFIPLSYLLWKPVGNRRLLDHRWYSLKRRVRILL